MVIDLIVNEGLPSATVVSRTGSAAGDGDGYDGGVLLLWTAVGCWPSILRAQKLALADPPAGAGLSQNRNAQRESPLILSCCL